LSTWKRALIRLLIHRSVNNVIHRDRARVRELHVPRPLCVATFTRVPHQFRHVCGSRGTTEFARDRSTIDVDGCVRIQLCRTLSARKHSRVTNYTTCVVVRVAFSVKPAAQPWARTTRTCSTTTGTRWRTTTTKTT